jgi:hypothetical protein
MTESVGIAAWGVARLSLAEIAGLRRELPAWSAPDLSGHFFKNADEQTIVAVRAVSQAIERHGLDVAEQRAWGVIGCPRFMGRMASAATIARFVKGGVRAMSPHIIPQHSLHSISGALSILLGTHGPNVGVGGGPRAWEDGLLAGLAMFSRGNVAGCWLVATDWSPEPLPDAQGIASPDAVCSAVALALRPAAAHAPCGRLQLGSALAVIADGPLPRATGTPVSDLVSHVAGADAAASNAAGTLARECCWRLSWGPTIHLCLRGEAARMRAAA